MLCGRIHLQSDDALTWAFRLEFQPSAGSSLTPPISVIPQFRVQRNIFSGNGLCLVAGKIRTVQCHARSYSVAEYFLPNIPLWSPKKQLFGVLFVTSATYASSIQSPEFSTNGPVDADPEAALALHLPFAESFAVMTEGPWSLNALSCSRIRMPTPDQGYPTLGWCYRHLFRFSFHGLVAKGCRSAHSLHQVVSQRTFPCGMSNRATKWQLLSSAEREELVCRASTAPCAGWKAASRQLMQWLSVVPML